MTEVEYKIDNDRLIRNTYARDEHNRLFICKVEPIITKEAFLKCYEEWVSKEAVEIAENNRAHGFNFTGTNSVPKGCKYQRYDEKGNIFCNNYPEYEAYRCIGSDMCVFATSEA